MLTRFIYKQLSLIIAIFPWSVVLSADFDKPRVEIIRYKSGEIHKIVSYRRDLRHGIFLVLFPSGSVSILENFKAGKRDGRSFVFYENGGIDTECEYKEDILHGNLTAYYANGNPRYKCTFSSNKKVGIETYWSIRGRILSEFTYNTDENLQDGIIVLSFRHLRPVWGEVKDGLIVRILRYNSSSDALEFDPEFSISILDTFRK